MPLQVAPVIDTYDVSLEIRLSLLATSVIKKDATPVYKYSKQELYATHMQNVTFLKTSQEQHYSRPFVLPSAYSPSTSSLNDLQKISLNSLKAEVHHRGYFITAKTITPPYVSTDAITIIEDDDGKVAKLEISFQDPFSPGAGLPENSTIAIKEPYLRYCGDGDYAIHVDHPSDIAVLRGDDPAVSMIMQVVAQNKEVKPSEWRVAGDEAYLGKNFSSAVECYTQAIDKAPEKDDKFRKDLYRKRAYANLAAQRFDFARQDALSSCSSESNDSNAQYCAGRAAYELCLYGESRKHFEKALGSDLGDSKIRKDYNRSLARIREEEAGLYDFEEMGKALSEVHAQLDHADFICNTTIAMTETKGRGLFATQDIPRGGLVLCEKAFAFPNMSGAEDHVRGILYNYNTGARMKDAAQGIVLLDLIQKLYNNPNLNSKFFDLDGGKYLRSGKEGKLIDGVPIIDIFLIEAIRLKNGFSYHEKYYRQEDKTKGEESIGAEGTLHAGIWLRAAYINHSCVPNCARSFVGDMMILRAICDIPMGTELTHHYSAPDPSFTTRQEVFKNNWDFECYCPLCSSERGSPDEKHKQRRDLVLKIRKEVIKWSRNARVPEAAIRNVERLFKKLDALHEPEVYATQARLFMVYPTIWLTEVNREKRNWAIVAKYAMEILRNFGFINPVREGKLWLDYQTGILSSETFNALQHGMEAYNELGKMELSKMCEDEALRMFAIITGGDNQGVDAAMAHRQSEKVA